MTRESRTAAQRGMTIIELMVAMVVLGIVTSAAFSVAFSIMNSYREHRRAMSVERSARGAIAVLVEAVRAASPGVPDGEIIDLVSCEPITDWQGIRVENFTDAPDAIDLIYGSGGADLVTSLRAPFSDASTEMVVENGTLLRPNDQVLVTDFDKGHLLTIRSAVQAGPDWNLSLDGAPSTLCPTVPTFNYATRSAVIRVKKVRFFISDAGGIPVLMMDPDGTPGPLVPVAVAEGVEDLQIAIGVDRDGNGAIGEDVAAAGNDDDWVYNHPADDVTPPLMAVTPYRAIRLTVIGRSVNETSTVATSLRPPAEDRAGATVPDVFRRRSLSTTVEIRNLKGSP